MHVSALDRLFGYIAEAKNLPDKVACTICVDGRSAQHGSHRGAGTRHKPELATFFCRLLHEISCPPINVPR